MVGYLFMFFVLLIAGIYFSAYQLSAAYPKFEYTLNAMTFVFLIAVPIDHACTCWGKKAENRPASAYFSSICIRHRNGKISCTCDYLCNPYCSSGNLSADHVKVRNRCIWLCVHSTPWIFLLGSANIAIGVFFSAITESQVIAAVLTFVFLFAFYMMNGISSFFSETAMSTCVTFGILIIALSLMIYSMIKNAVIWCCLRDWRSGTGNRLRCKIQRVWRRNPEGSWSV